MKIPNKVKIGWKTYKVKQKSATQTLIKEPEALCGSIYYDYQEIYINKDFNKKHQKAVLIHEVVHGISEMYGLDFDEKTVTTFSNGLNTAIKDNPQLFK